MRITVADPSRISDGAHTEDVSLTITGEGMQAIERVLWIPLASSFSPQNLDAFLQDSAPLWSLRPDACFLGIHPDCEVDDDVLDDVEGRIRGVPLYIVSLGLSGHELKHVRGPRLDLDPLETLGGLRQADVTSMLLHAGVHLPFDPAVHYEAPGGGHYSAFLRAGFSLRSMEDLDRVSFWLEPHVRGCTHVLVDHWSMIGLAYHVLGYTSRRGARADADFKVETLHRYTEGDQLAVRLSRNFRGSGSTGVALVSVTSTGYLAREVMAPALSKAGHIEPRIIALAQPVNAPSEVQHLAKLPEVFAPEAAECARCSEGVDVLIPIQRDSYLLALSAYSSQTAIKAVDAAQGRALLAEYGGVGAFSVHRTHDDGRHHAYYANVEPMLDLPVFTEHLEERLTQLPSELDLVVAPDLPAARRLAELVAERVSIGRVVHADERELLSDVAAGDAIASADNILYLDDVVITGRRLLGYRRSIITALRRRDEADRELALWALVALARPRSRRSYVGIKDIVHHQKSAPRFFAVEHLLLPNWDSSQCPWCREERVLRALEADGLESAHVRRRIEHLASQGGLPEPLYFDWPNGSGVERVEEEPTPELLERYGKDDVWTLRQGSVFGDVQGADLATSVAAAVQELRSSIGADGKERRSDLDDQFRSPISKVLDPDLYIAGRFYEPVLVAAILRASRPHDLNPPGQQDLQDALVRELRAGGSSSILIGEILLKIAAGDIAALPSSVFEGHEAAGPLLERFLLAARLSRRGANS